MTDLLLDVDGDLQFTDGDLRTGESTVQHQRELLWLDKGFHRFAPAVGVGVERSLLASETTGLRVRAAIELRRDGLPDTLSLDTLTLYAD